MTLSKRTTLAAAGIVAILLTESLSAQVCENCGIGTNNPASKLEVKGCDDSTLTSALNVTDSSGASLFYIRDDGNIGIGTTSLGSYQTYRLTLKQLSSVAGKGFRILNADESKSAEFRMGASGAVLNAEGSADLHLQTGGTNRLYINNSTGNTGLGTTGPDRKLDVLDASNPQLRLTHTDGTVYSDLQTTSSGYLYLNPSGGRVGIGTSTPDYMVDMENTTTTANLRIISTSGSGDLILDGSTNNDARIFLRENGTGKFTLGLDGSDGDKFKIGTTGLETSTRLTIDASGNVGVGTSSPGALFEVGGTDNMIRAWRGSGYAPIRIYSSGDGTHNNSNLSIYSYGYGGSQDLRSEIANWGGIYTYSLGASAGTKVIAQLNSTGNGSAGQSHHGRFVLFSVTDAQTGYYNGTANVDLRANGSSYLNGGNVGIGTATPSSLLSVGSSSQFQVNSTGDLIKINNVTYSWPGSQGAADQVLTNNGSGTLSWASGSSVMPSGTSGQTLRHNGTDWVANSVIFNNGTNVGIGTASPSSVLDVAGSAEITGGLNVGSASGAGTGFIYAFDGSDGGNFGKDDGDLLDIRDGAIYFKQNTGWEYQMLTTDFSAYSDNSNDLGTAAKRWRDFYTYDGFFAGNIGIGTVTPSTTLDIESAPAAGGIDINNTAADGDPTLAFQLSGTSTFTLGVDDGDGDKFKIGTTAIGTNTRLTIDASGNIGIGTTSPSSTLSIGGAGNANWKVYAYNTTASTDTRGVHGECAEPTTSSNKGFGVLGRTESGTGFAHGVYGQASTATASSGRAYGVFGNASNATSGFNYAVYGYLTGSNNGAAIYGTLSGDVSIPGNYAGYFNGLIRTTNDAPEKPNAGSWTGYSDTRLKQNISSFSDGLAVISQINPIRYQYKNVGGLPYSKTYIGIAAQDVAGVAPYCVSMGKIHLKANEVASFGGNAILHSTVTNPDGSTEQIYEADVYTYNPDGLFYALINAIKELDARNLALEARIAALETK